MQERERDAVRLRDQVAREPADRVSWHNLAAAEGDVGNALAAETAARRAIALGIAAPETRLVLARALAAQGRLDDADRMFEEALRLRPGYVEAHHDLAQLRWMRTGSAAEALRVLEARRASHPTPALHFALSVALESMGEDARALAAADEGLAASPSDLQLLRQASHLCGQSGDARRALALANAAVAAAPRQPEAHVTLCEALLAAGRAADAEPIAAALCAARPLDQYPIAMRATAWRLLGDSRYRELYDYNNLVSSVRIDVPAGWDSLDAFLRAVADDLHALHCFATHPFEQSVRGGGQLSFGAREMQRPAIRALFESIGAATLRHLRKVGKGSDPFRSRNTGDFAITGAWSVRLASSGYHTDHVHPQGWLSSAFYVAVPEFATAGAEHAGWLRLGRPSFATQPPLAADAYLKPEPGVLALFPAYVWHGVETFQSRDPRVTVAFDALPG